MIARVAAAVLSFTLGLAVASGPASACSCERPPATVTGFEQQKAWEFARASNVAHGKIISIHAGEGVVRDDMGGVLVTMRVDKVLKGNVPTGDITIVTKASSVSCGMGERLLIAAEDASELSIELSSGDRPQVFGTSWCGYFRFGPEPSRSSR